jgi:hypothetical protein
MHNQSEVTSFETVDALLAYAATHMEARDLPVRVSGFYMGFRPGRGPARFGVLLERLEQIEDVERLNCVPADINFALNLSIRIQGVLGVVEPLRPPVDRSWVTMEGLLSCWPSQDGTPWCHLAVTRTEA